MESTTASARDGAGRQDRQGRSTGDQRADEQSRQWPTRAWASTRGKLLDERAFLAALGRGGAQRMAIPLGEG